MTTRRNALAVAAAVCASLCSDIASGRPAAARRFESQEEMHPASSREWWRIAARLRAGDGRDLALIATFFRYALPAKSGDALAAISSLTDLSSGRRIVSQRAGREDLGDASASSQLLSLRVDDWRCDAVDGVDRRPVFSLHVGDPDGSAALMLRAERSSIVRVPQTPYASYPRLAVTGRMAIAGSATDVSGTAWMDHAIGAAAIARDVSWDLYSLQLLDGRDVTIYAGRSRAGEVRVAVSLLDIDGTLHSLPPQTHARAIARSPYFWRSARSGATYPDIVQFSFPSFGLAFSVSPVVADQEIVEEGGAFTYWDGAVDVVDFTSGGSKVGSGFAQLTGYRPDASADTVP